MTSGGDLCHVGMSKLISETNQQTGPCVIQFVPKGLYQKIISASGKYTIVFIWKSTYLFNTIYIISEEIGNIINQLHMRWSTMDT